MKRLFKKRFKIEFYISVLFILEKVDGKKLRATTKAVALVNGAKNFKQILALELPVFCARLQGVILQYFRKFCSKSI